MAQKTSIIDAIYSLKPEYKTAEITVVSNNNVVADMDINWAGKAPISNSNLQTEYDKLIAAEEKYIEPRKLAYPSIAEQLDKLYHDMTAGKLDATGEWHKAIKAVKDANPKP